MKYFYAFFLLVAATLFWFFSKPSTEDVATYAKLQESALRFQKQEGVALMASSEQMPKKVVKEIWWGEVEPLYLRIECARSKLMAMKTEEKYEVVEKMEGIRCLLQERLFYLFPDGRTGSLNADGKVVVKEGDKEVLVDPTLKTLSPMQEVRYFEAKEGTLRYSGLELTGQEVKMARYRLRGHAPPPFTFTEHTPLTTGEGKKVVFMLKEGGVDVKLETLRAQFNPKEGL